MSTEATTATDPGLRLRLSLCALDLAIRHAEATGRPSELIGTPDGRLLLGLPGGEWYEIRGDEMDEFQGREWVEVDDGEMLVRLTERGRYWAGRWSRDRSFLRAVGVL